MSLAETIQRVRSGVFHIMVRDDAGRKGSGTAFVSCGYLITNFHVANVPAGVRVTIRREGDSMEDGHTIKGQKFRRSIVTSSDERNLDYAVLDIPEVTQRPDTYSFRLGSPEGYLVGSPIALLGYPYEHLNLVTHSGIISSFYESGPAEIIQIDASVNPSNSGGPLIDPETGDVLGIITRRATGLTAAIAEMRKALTANIKVLDSAGASISMGGVDLISALKAGQVSLHQIVNEIERQANVGIGYAFSIEHLKNDNVIFYALQQANGKSG